MCVGAGVFTLSRLTTLTGGMVGVVRVVAMSAGRLLCGMTDDSTDDLSQPRRGTRPAPTRQGSAARGPKARTRRGGTPR
jgi:hypothetical protein